MVPQATWIIPSATGGLHLACPSRWLDSSILLPTLRVVLWRAIFSKHAKEEPIVILDNGEWDTVILGYAQYEQLFQRLLEHEAIVLEGRVDRLENHPESAVPWRQVKRSRDSV
jgi:hypothetical protein